MSYDYAHEIVPRLWLGNKKASLDTEFLTKNNITVVFNCTKDLPFTTLPGIRKYRVPIDDNLQAEEIANLREWAPEVIVKLMREYRAGKTILVHCFAGMQRSAAVVALFLIATTGRPSADVIAFIREKRPVAFFPMANFSAAMNGFQHDLMVKMNRVAA